MVADRRMREVVSMLMKLGEVGEQVMVGGCRRADWFAKKRVARR